MFREFGVQILVDLIFHHNKHIVYDSAHGMDEADMPEESASHPSLLCRDAIGAKTREK